MKNKQTNRQTDRQIYNAEQIYIYRDFTLTHAGSQNYIKFYFLTVKCKYLHKKTDF